MTALHTVGLIRPPKPPIGQRIGSGFLRVLGAATTPLLPSDYLDLVDPLRAGASLRGRILSVTPETRECVTVVIKVGRGWTGHVPGQYVRIGIDVDGVRCWRAYSITSGARSDGHISITVKAIPDGRVSNHIVRSARPGALIHLDPATGDFRLPDPAPARVLFVTAGSGITPVMGMLRTSLGGRASSGSDQARRTVHARDPDPSLSEVVLLHSAPTPADVIFGAELRQLASEGRIRLIERHTDSEGLLTADQLVEQVPDWQARQTWACGPLPLLEALEGHWDAAGIPERLHTERFRPHILVTGDGGPVRFERSGATVEAGGGTPLLTAAEDAGILMKSGCRMGICFGCVVPLKQGAVRDLRNGNLTTAEQGDAVVIQTCISAAAGECVIDA